MRPGGGAVFVEDFEGASDIAQVGGDGFDSGEEILTKSGDFLRIDSGGGRSGCGSPGFGDRDE